MTQEQRRRALLRLGALGTWGGLGWLGARHASAAPATSNCPVVPQETEGPFPADGTTMQPPNGMPGAAYTGMPPPGAAPMGGPGHAPPGLGTPGTQAQAFNVLTLPGVVRSDLRRNLDGSGEVGGVPLSLRIHLVNHGAACSPLAGHAIYVWHCTREGDYSVYGSGDIRDNRLRGVQVTDAQGQVRFSTIVPGCYMGRMPHIHFEVYAGLAQTVNGRNALATSQLAFPTDTMAQVYARAAGYQASARHLAQMSFASDMVFADGVALQMVKLQGSLAQGFDASLQVAIAV